MLRLLLTLLCGFATAAALLLLRQSRVELQHQCNATHDEMLDVQADLWRQQVQIAAATAPAALEMALAKGALRMAPDGEATPWDGILSATGQADLVAPDAATAAGRTPPVVGDTGLDWALLDPPH